MTELLGDKLNWAREEPIALPSADKEGRLAIRRSDWKRLRRTVEQARKPVRNLPTWYSVCFSVAGSAGVSVIPIASSQNLPAWVCPAYVVTTIGAGLLGVALVAIDRNLRAQERSLVEDLKADIEEIEQCFGVRP